MFSFSCGDVLPGCAAHFDGDTRSQLVADVGAHAAADHGITDLTPELVAAVEGHIVTR